MEGAVGDDDGDSEGGIAFYDSPEYQLLPELHSEMIRKETNAVNGVRNPGQLSPLPLSSGP